MKVNVSGKLAALGAACALVVVGPLAAGAQASTQRASASTDAVAVTAIVTVFNLSGTYDVGGPARPVISNANDVLTVDMSAFGRPNGFGTVIDRDIIRVTFPDDATYGAVLIAPGTIRWSNGTQWRKLTRIPSVIRQTEFDARQILRAAGFVGFVSSTPIDRTCQFINVVRTQNPAAGTLALPGTVVSLSIPREPPEGCIGD